jgi:PAS domain S-box-containing protein
MKMKILAIDDKKDNLISISALIKSLMPECETITASSGLEGLIKAEANFPDVIILDIKMPEMDGFEVCRRLKNNEKINHIPIIMLTAVATDSKSRIKALEIGADSFLTKPIDPAELIAQVKVMLRIKQNEDALRQEKIQLDKLVIERTNLLQVSEEKYKRIFETAAISIILVDKDGIIVDVNPYHLIHNAKGRACKEDYLGVELISHPTIVNAGLSQEYKKVLEGYIMNQEAAFFPITTGDTDSYFNIRGAPMLIDGKVNGAVFVHENITERLQIEKDLRQSEQNLAYAQKIASIGSWCWDIKENTLDWSDELYRIVGVEKDTFKAVYEAYLGLIHPEDRELFKLLTQNVLREKKSYSFEYRIIRPDKREISVIERGEVISGENGEPLKLLGTVQDITIKKQAQLEKKKLEERSHQSQKMEVIGTLAGGIAHDFNNILAIIIGYSQMAKEDAELGSQFYNDLENILDAGIRAKDLINQILTFSRQARVEKINMNPGPIIKEALKLLRAAIPKSIEIRKNIFPEDELIHADPTQIHQILMNLCTNASHAMEKSGGVLEVGLMKAEKIPLELQENDQLVKNYLLLEVKDNGHGIKPEIIDSIFEPFFTTKEQGKGTGMGLSIAYGIVQEYGGQISVSSKPGQGTCFQVYLPCIDQGTINPDLSKEEIIRGRGNILFVDDEKVLVQMGELMLEKLGYQVFGEQCPLKALKMFKEKTNQFDLIITDLDMPKMSGLELARRVLQVRPKIPIIICSGYSTIIDEKTVKTLGLGGLVYKPLLKGELTKLIHKLLVSES